MERGDILLRTKDRIIEHPVIFWEWINRDQFVGIMLTTSDRYNDNINLAPEHFERVSELGKLYTVKHKNSHFVSTKLEKSVDWVKPIPKGKLSEEGVVFIAGHLPEGPPISWPEYLLQSH